MLYKTKGIVLKTFPFDEADVIVRIFSRDNGKIDMLAKGAKKLRSKLAASVQPFTVGEYTYYQKNNNLAVLRQSDIIKNYKNIVSQLKLTFTCYYICEFLDYFIPENQENSKVFDLTVKTLELINIYPNHRQILLLTFKIKAMALQGYSPQLNNCVKCGENKPNTSFIFSVNEGGLICNMCLPNNKSFLQKKDILLLIFLLKSTYEEILRIGISVSDIRSIEKIINTFIQFHSDGHIFKSENFLKNLT